MDAALAGASHSYRCAVRRKLVERIDLSCSYNSISKSDCCLSGQTLRLKTRLRPRYLHDCFDRSDHDGGIEILLSPFSQRFMWSWKAERFGSVRNY